MTPAERVLLQDPNCPRDLLRRRIRELEAEVKRLTLNPTHRGGWTEDEDAIVRGGYERGYKLAVIRAELKVRGHRERSLGGISGRAQVLGCASLFAPNAWTDEQDEILRTSYAAGATYAEIRRQLLAIGSKRNRAAIGMRAISIGISGDRANPWSETELAIAVPGLEIGRLFRDIEAALRAAGYERSKGSVSKLARKLGLSRPADNWSDVDEAALQASYAARRPVAAIAKELGKSYGAVTSKAMQLGLKTREARRKAA